MKSQDKKGKGGIVLGDKGADRMRVCGSPCVHKGVRNTSKGGSEE